VVVCHTVESQDTSTQTYITGNYRTALIYSVLGVTFIVLLGLGYVVGDMWFRLNSLKVKVEEGNAKELEVVKSELKYLAKDVTNLTHSSEVLRMRLKEVANRVDRLQLYKEGEPYYLLIAQAPPLPTQAVFLVLLCSWAVCCY